ncbi:hypothetical protein DFH28DRAFT_287513 [Melampsora americana]|nr:hypothetical protein DFH28DRAFT_287513 [Melampsora americana]
MVQKKSKPKPNQNQTKFKSTSLRTTRTTRTPSQSLLISISIFKLILISISIHLSFLISNYSLNPIYGQTLNEFYQTQSHQFIHLFLIPISFTFTLSFFNRFQKSKKLHLLSNLTSLYFLILSIFIQRLPLLYSFNNWFESDLKYFKLYPLLSALKGELPIRFLGILIGFLNLESALNDDRSNPFQNQPSFIKSTRIFILSFIFHLFLKLTQNPFHQFILSIFEPCEVVRFKKKNPSSLSQLFSSNL